eukprot:4820616-Heterocapsa_arctica.AAC.1
MGRGIEVCSPDVYDHERTVLASRRRVRDDELNHLERGHGRVKLGWVSGVLALELPDNYSGPVVGIALRALVGVYPTHRYRLAHALAPGDLV